MECLDRLLSSHQGGSCLSPLENSLGKGCVLDVAGSPVSGAGGALEGHSNGEAQARPEIRMFGNGFGAWQLFAWRGPDAAAGGRPGDPRPLHCGPICVILRGLQAIFGRAAQPNAGGGSAAGAYGQSMERRLDWPRLCRTPTLPVPRGNKWSLQRQSTATLEPLKSKAKCGNSRA